MCPTSYIKIQRGNRGSHPRIQLGHNSRFLWSVQTVPNIIQKRRDCLTEHHPISLPHARGCPQHQGVPGERRLLPRSRAVVQRIDSRLDDDGLVQNAATELFAGGRPALPFAGFV